MGNKIHLKNLKKINLLMSHLIKEFIRMQARDIKKIKMRALKRMMMKKKKTLLQKCKIQTLIMKLKKK